MIELDLVTLLVGDVERSRSFYQGVLGLDVVRDSGGYVELAGGSGNRLALFPARDLADRLELTDDEASSSRGLAVVVSFVLENLDAGYAAIVARGAKPFRPPAVVPWGKRVAFVRDPDGNLVELTDARGDEKWGRRR